MRFLILSLTLFFSACASKKGSDSIIQLDDYITEGGRVSWARVHYPFSKVENMNKARRNKAIAVIRETCGKYKPNVIRENRTDSWSVKLKKEYPKPREIMVVEFECR